MMHYYSHNIADYRKDTSHLTLLEHGCLESMKRALDEFAICSGLTCNYDKSFIMPINPIDQGTRMMIEGFGYTITDSIKLLGVNVSNKLDNTPEIYGELITKLRSLVK